jgi:hypothetical protein
MEIIPLSLNKDKVVLEAKMEEIINGDSPIETKELEIKRILSEIVLNEQMMMKWVGYFTDSELDS